MDTQSTFLSLICRRFRQQGYVAVTVLFTLVGCAKNQMELPNLTLSDKDPKETGSIGDNGRSRPVGVGEYLPDPSVPARAQSAVVITGSGQFFGSAKPPKGGKGARGDKNHSLNLLNVSITEAAAAVLGDILNVNYTIDPRLDSKLTIQTTRPTTQAALVDLFLAALRNVGAVVVQSGDSYRIVAADNVATTTARLWPNSNRSVSGPLVGAATKLIQLRYISASEMRRILEPMAAVGNAIQVDEARNALIVTGTEQDIESFEETISVFDVDAMRGMSFALVPLAAADPEAIVEDLQKIFGAGKEGMNGMVQFVANKRLKTVLIISKQPRYLKEAQAWVKRYESRAMGAERQYYTYPLRNRQAKEVVDVLNSIFARDLASSDPTPRQSVAPRFRPTSVSSSGGGPNVLRGGSDIIPLQVAGAGNSADQSRASFDARFEARQEGGTQVSSVGMQGPGPNGEVRVKIVADESNNSLITLATHADYQRVMRVIKSLDQVPSQVLIEATIVEVTLKDNLKFGVRWMFNNGKHAAAFTNALDGAVASTFPGFSYALKLANSQVILNALQAVTKVNVLSSPSLMALDNRQAVLQIGDQVPITTQSATGTLVPGAPIINSVSYRDTGVILAITPRINESGRILLEIEQEVASVSKTTSSNIDSPTIGRRRVRTTVLANNGESITLGGLIQDKTVRTSDQIPLLGDIPLFGNLFKEKDNTTEKTELIIIITPRVARNLDESREVTDEYRGRIKEIQARANTPRAEIARKLSHALD